MIALSVLATAAGMLPAWLVGGLAVQMRAELGFDEFQLGLTTALFFGVSAVASIPGGRIVERIGWRHGVVVTATVSIVGLLLLAALAQSWVALLVFLVVLAAGNATAQPSANLALARSIPAHRKGLGFGIKQAAVPFAALLAGLAVPLIAITVGWRWAFVAAAGLGTIVLALVPWGRDRSEPTAARAKVRLGQGDDAPVRVLVLLAIAAGFGTASTNALASFIVSFAVFEGLRPGAAGMLLAVGSGLGLTVRIIAGWRADQRVGGHLRFCLVMLGGGAVGFVLLSIGGQTWLLALGTLLCFGMGWAWNGVFVYAVMEANRGATAAATGVIMVGKFIGGTAGPLLFGLTVALVSYRAAWLLAAGFMTTSLVQMQVARLSLRRSRREEPAG